MSELLLLGREPVGDAVPAIRRASSERPREAAAYRAAGGPSTQLWEISGGGHTGGLSAVSDEYERRVVDFFDRALLAAPG